MTETELKAAAWDRVMNAKGDLDAAVLEAWSWLDAELEKVAR